MPLNQQVGGNPVKRSRRPLDTYDTPEMALLAWWHFEIFGYRDERTSPPARGAKLSPLANEREWCATLTKRLCPPPPIHVLDPCAGSGNIVNFLQKRGWIAEGVDISPRAPNIQQGDFLDPAFVLPNRVEGIIMNPPFGKGPNREDLPVRFVSKALEMLPNGYVAMFGRLLWMESEGRYPFFRAHPPNRVYVFSGRIACGESALMCFAWYVWDRLNKGPFPQPPSIYWLPPEYKWTTRI